ncbi:uncharacterized protein A4U43_C08F33850 [Asparagus officinalis]|nr:uncharacterized protein A4U43_C08F33850 [Asparagus officinalis]
MEAHSLLQRHGFDVSSYSTGAHVKLPGPSYREPNVYEFGTPYHKMYDDLLRKNPELYKRNGILPMLKRNMSVKLAPQRWQDNAADGPFDVVLSFEDKKFCPDSRFPATSSDEGFNNHRAAGARLERKDVDNNENSNNSRPIKVRRKDKEIAFEATSTLSSPPPERNRSLEIPRELFALYFSVDIMAKPKKFLQDPSGGTLFTRLDGLGASEETIRGCFKEAYRTAPLIILIDEIDAIASKRENLQSEMEWRIVTQLMTCNH